MKMPDFPSSSASESLPVHPDTLSADPLTHRLRALHDDYAEMANTAVTEGRDGLLQQLADRYAGEALALITTGASSAA
jgi:hypothetical protein